MSALFDRTNGSIKWPLVAHTAAMFSFVTVYTAMYLNIQSICFIDNREYPGADGGLPPGPFGYQQLIYNKAISFVAHIVFMLNTWLADGLLVSFFSHQITRVSNVGSPSSSIVVTSSIPKNTGLSPFHA